MILLGFAQTPGPDRPEDPLEGSAAPDPSAEQAGSVFGDSDDSEQPAEESSQPAPIQDADSDEQHAADLADAADAEPEEVEPEAPAFTPAAPDSDDVKTVQMRARTPEDASVQEAAALHEEEEDYDDRGGDAISAMIPWAISLMLHAALVLVAIFIVWSVKNVVDDEEVIIPIIGDSDTPGVPLQMQVQERVETAQASSVPAANPSTADAAAAGVGEVSVDVALPGLGEPLSTPAFSGLELSDNAQFDTQFLGSGGNARKIVFVIDASGSLADTMPFVVEELKRTIREMGEKQQFGVVYTFGQMQRGKMRPQVEDVIAKGMRKATSDHRGKVIAWLEQNKYAMARGSGDTVAGIRRALSYRPDLVFLLSDDITGVGEYSIDQQKLLNEIDAANRSKTAINTIQFLYPDPLEAVGRKGTLQLIAERTGGSYTFYDGEALGL